MIGDYTLVNLCWFLGIDAISSVGFKSLTRWSFRIFAREHFTYWMNSALSKVAQNNMYMFLVFCNVSHSPRFSQRSLAVAQRCGLLTPSTPLDTTKYVLALWTHSGYLHIISLSSTSLFINPPFTWKIIILSAGELKAKQFCICHVLMSAFYSYASLSLSLLF